MRAARIKTTFALFLIVPIAAVSAGPAVAQSAPQSAGSSTAITDKPFPADLALEYTYVHSNAPPTECDCFNLNGGSATFAWTLKPGDFALVGDITSAHANGIGPNGLDLTLSAFTAGVRYQPKMGHSPFHPYGQVLVGVAHASGTLAQAPNPAASNADAAFAANVGGGLDLRASPRFSIRLIEAGYIVTTFDNGGNDHQNNLRISSGVVFHF